MATRTQENPKLYIVLLVYQCVSWLVFLGGVASSQDNCSSTDFEAVRFNQTIYFGQSNCSTFFGFPWWICFYQLFFLIIAIFFTIRDELGEQKLPLIAILSPLTALMMNTANAFVKLAAEVGGNQTNTAAAGAIMLSMGNLVMSYYIGLQSEGMQLPKSFNPAAASPRGTIEAVSPQ
ncbi:hypothetical protein PSENEW3_00001221 [Picochlorum sp. SENEW3]|nr:hypothetical protein PSENEW3_00001221 [Picochlorum sp. SENEW3]